METNGPQPDWPPLTLADRLELQLMALAVQYEHLERRVAAIELAREMEN